MRDFLDDLDARLQAMADAHPELDELAGAAPAADAPPASAARRRRRPAALGALTAALAAIVAAFTMTGTSLADLPILSTPTKDASSLKEKAKAAAKAGVDFQKAHVFDTPGGPGYVLVNPKTQTLCLVIPDPQAPGDYGSSCDTPITKIERDGLVGEIVGDQARDPEAAALMAFVLPEGATDVRLTRTPPGTEFDVDSGIAVILTKEPTELQWTVDGKPGSRPVEGPFKPATGVLWTCPDGSLVPGPPLPEGNLAPAEAQKIVKAARGKACAGRR